MGGERRGRSEVAQELSWWFPPKTPRIPLSSIESHTLQRGWALIRTQCDGSGETGGQRRGTGNRRVREERGEMIHRGVEKDSKRVLWHPHHIRGRYRCLRKRSGDDEAFVSVFSLSVSSAGAPGQHTESPPSSKDSLIRISPTLFFFLLTFQPQVSKGSDKGLIFFIFYFFAEYCFASTARPKW